MNLREKIDDFGERMKPALCSEESKLGDFAEFIVGDVARKCWCCTFWRGFVAGILPLAPVILLLIIKEII